MDIEVENIPVIEETETYCLRCGARDVMRKYDTYRCFSCNYEWTEEDK